MNKVQTIDLKGNDYATVPQRLKAFRQSNPRAEIKTDYKLEDGELVFTASILSDKSKPDSASATGHSYGKMTGDKAFEKLETVSIGRALSILGYLNNGQIASTEEMVEFEEYQQDQFQEALDAIKTAEKREDFARILSKLNAEQKRLATPVINQRIKELKDGTTSRS